VIPGVGRSFHIRAGIIDAGYSWHTDLKQTKFLTIRMQAICLSIDGDTIDCVNLLKQLG
jgi:hypothetical protein